MNNVQSTYAPPRLAALILGVAIFALYQLWWEPSVNRPVPIAFAALNALVLGYGIAMLGWLIRQTIGQVGETFRPTRGRIIATIALFLVTPFGIMDYLPWIVAGLLPLFIMSGSGDIIGICLVALVVIYPVASMIVRHTYERRLLRFGLFALVFWTAYAVLTLKNGVQVFSV